MIALRRQALALLAALFAWRPGRIAAAAGEGRHICLRAECRWVYDPALGDPIGRIPAGTAFDDLPEDWRCPVCGNDREEFMPLRPPATPAR